MNPFEHEKRRRLTDMDYARIFAACDGTCVECKRRLGPADSWNADHRIALENGGKDEIENLQVLCEGCHTIKTKDDHKSAGHIRRSYTKHVVPRELRRDRGWGRRR